MKTVVAGSRRRAGAGGGFRWGERIPGTNSVRLSAAERTHWERLEADQERRAWRDRMHWADMVPGLGLCRACLGWVDDPRHTGIYPARGVR